MRRYVVDELSPTLCHHPAGIFACAALNQDWRAMYDRLGPIRAPRTFGRLAWMDALGVPFIAGTDAGLPGSVFDNLAGALGLYSWLGFPNDRIIEFATVNAASALGLAAVTGQLVPGLAADLLVVEGDPLTNLDALHKVRMVMTSGTVHHCAVTNGDVVPTGRHNALESPKGTGC
jgi:predicted amidohydrolase YtcJ